MEQQLHNLQIAFFATLIAMVPVFGVFLKNYLELRTKHSNLQLRMESIDADDTERTRKIFADAQVLIQQTFGEQAGMIRSLQDEVRHQRGLIDTGASERAVLTSQKEELEKKLIEAQKQQKVNIDKLATMETYVEQLKSLTAENIKLRGEIAELRQMIEDAETKATSRHQEMSRITGDNFELTVKLQQAEEQLNNARRLLRECHEETLKLQGKEMKHKETDHDLEHPEG